MIEVDSLTRVYGSLVAVDRVSFSINKGAIVGLLGHNGAGKSTVMKIMTGYLEPTSGSVRIAGLDVCRNRRAVQKRIGYLPENCPVWPEMTVIDYLTYHAGLRGISGKSAELFVARAISRTMLQEKALDRIDTLSRGYRQRVGVAQAILHNPDVIILDEPTNGLDPTQVRGMRRLIRELAEYATVIISTHILQEVRAVCDRVLIMRAGHLVLDRRMDSLEPSEYRIIRVLTDRNVSQFLSEIKEVSVLSCTPDSRGRISYDLRSNEDSLPVIARTIHDAGALLYALEPQYHDLEMIFSEMNEENDDAA